MLWFIGTLVVVTLVGLAMTWLTRNDEELARYIRGEPGARGLWP